MSHSRRYHLVTLGCPKNEVDSDKVEGTLLAEGMAAVGDAGDADLIVVNTCAFIESARQESIDTILALDQARRQGSRLVVTGCMAERYGDELAEALPEVDAVVGFGGPMLAPPPEPAATRVQVSLGPTRRSARSPRPTAPRRRSRTRGRSGSPSRLRSTAGRPRSPGSRGRCPPEPPRPFPSR